MRGYWKDFFCRIIRPEKHKCEEMCYIWTLYALKSRYIWLILDEYLFWRIWQFGALMNIHENRDFAFGTWMQKFKASEGERRPNRPHIANLAICIIQEQWEISKKPTTTWKVNPVRFFAVQTTFFHCTSLLGALRTCKKKALPLVSVHFCFFLAKSAICHFEKWRKIDEVVTFPIFLFIQQRWMNKFPIGRFLG